MVDVTSATVFYPSNNPIEIRGKASASDGDSWIIPYGQLLNCIVNPEDDDDAIATATVSGSTVSLNLTDDAGANVTADTDINFIATLRTQ